MSEKVLYTGLAKNYRTPFTYFTKNFFQDEKGRTLKWGDEVEYIIVLLDHKVNLWKAILIMITMRPALMIMIMTMTMRI